MSKKRKLLVWSLSILLVLGILFTAFAVFVSIYYKADEDAVSASLSANSITVDEKKDFTAFIPREECKTGFIFYPGGKVEHKAYYPLMKTLAEYGIFSAVVNMPLRLAFFDMDAADKVIDTYPSVTDWYIGGHSLGGAMAASYASKNESDFKGLVLLGAYSAEDLSDSDMAVLSVYGSLDGVMNREKYENNLSYMPNKFTEFIIEGGCHAYFGAYGEQKGDGTATVSNDEQIYITASQIYQFINSN